MLSGAAGISGLMSKPPGGFVSARMNSRQRQRHRDTELQADAKTNPSVLLSIRIVPVRDDFQSELRPVETTDGIHQWMNPWNSVATYRRNRQVWGLLIAGLIRSAISRPLDLFRRRLAGGDSTVSSLDETYQWFHPAGPVCFFGCGPRAALGKMRDSAGCRRRLRPPPPFRAPLTAST